MNCHVHVLAIVQLQQPVWPYGALFSP